MSTEPDHQSNNEKAIDEAASWMWKLDRGLTGAEQDAFFDWLAVDARHPNLINEQKVDWERLDALAAWCPAHGDSPNPDLLEIKVASSIFPFGRKLIWLPLAVAASIAIVAWFALDANGLFQPPATQIAPPPTRLTLEDGSIIKLKDETRIMTRFTVSERRVILERGEAFFMVAKDPRRPFIVEIDGIGIHAVGTAFNVRLSRDQCEILVTEGIVAVLPEAESPTSSTLDPAIDSLPNLQAYERGVFARLNATPTFSVSKVSRQEAQKQLVWRHHLLRFESTPLSAIIEELNQLNETQLVLANQDLARTEFNGSFRSDNLDGFVRLLEIGYHLTVEKSEDDKLITINVKS
jgi:transmembrane sensor